MKILKHFLVATKVQCKDRISLFFTQIKITVSQNVCEEESYSTVSFTLISSLIRYAKFGDFIQDYII